MSYYQDKVAAAIRKGRQTVVRKHEEAFQEHMECILRTLSDGYLQNRFRIVCRNELETAAVECKFKAFGFETQSVDILTFYVFIPIEELEKSTDVTSIPDMA